MDSFQESELVFKLSTEEERCLTKGKDRLRTHGSLKNGEGYKGRIKNVKRKEDPPPGQYTNFANDPKDGEQESRKKKSGSVKLPYKEFVQGARYSISSRRMLVSNGHWAAFATEG